MIMIQLQESFEYNFCPFCHFSQESSNHSDSTIYLGIHNFAFHIESSMRKKYLAWIKSRKISKQHELIFVEKHVSRYSESELSGLGRRRSLNILKGNALGRDAVYVRILAIFDNIQVKLQNGIRFSMHCCKNNTMLSAIHTICSYKKQFYKKRW